MHRNSKHINDFTPLDTCTLRSSFRMAEIIMSVFRCLSIIIFTSIFCCSSQATTFGTIRNIHTNKIPKGNWSCVKESKQNESDYIRCIANVDCQNISCYVWVFDKTNHNCCSVAPPYDWIVLQVCDSSLEDKVGVDTLIVHMEDASSDNRKQFANVWPPARAFLLDEANKATDFGYRQNVSGVNSFTNNMKWTYEGTMNPKKSVMPRFASFDYSKHSYIKIWKTDAFDLSGTVSVTMWLKISAPTNVNSYFFAFRTDNKLISNVRLYPTHAADRLYFFAREKEMKTNNNAVENHGPWTHVAFTWTASGPASMFVNGFSQPVTQVYPRPEVLPEPDMYLLLGWRGQSDYYFNGGMACVFIYERALTSDDLNEVMKLC